MPDGSVVDADDGPRAGVTYEAVSALAPAFRTNGTVTAGNACPLNDGAAALVVMSDTRAVELGITPLARIVSTAVTGLSPEIMGLGPVEAVPLALVRAGLASSDIDLFEINEAFAVQALGSAQLLGIPIDKLNVNGGAIAVGHPFGMTGARLTSTLVNSLQHYDKQWGSRPCASGVVKAWRWFWNASRDAVDPTGSGWIRVSPSPANGLCDVAAARIPQPGQLPK